MRTALSTLLWLVVAILSSELLGYLLHRLMHCGKVPFLSRNHMRHHLLLYGPLDPQQPASEYLDATNGQLSLGNIGVEWLLPGIAILASAVLCLHLLHVTAAHAAFFISGSLTWSFLMFSYLHDCMHVAGFWMEHNRWLRRWFVVARRSHDIHHWSLNDEGFMNKNFGIGFFFFDRLFGTFDPCRSEFNAKGYLAAQERFRDLFSRTDAGMETEEIRTGCTGEMQSNNQALHTT